MRTSRARHTGCNRRRPPRRAGWSRWRPESASAPRKRKAGAAQQRAQARCWPRSAGGGLRGARLLARAQMARHKVARAHAQREADGLIMAIRLNTTPTAPAAAVLICETKNVSAHVVDAGHQHADDGGHCQPCDKARDGRLRHKAVMRFPAGAAGRRRAWRSRPFRFSSYEQGRPAGRPVRMRPRGAQRAASTFTSGYCEARPHGA